jgi:hypothetical protein
MGIRKNAVRNAVPLMAGLALGLAGLAQAGDRLLATGGVMQIEGAAGGGLTPWALIAGYGTRDQVGVAAFHTGADTGDFHLRAAGVAIGIFDRLELSFARQRFELGTTAPGRSIGLEVAGAKIRLMGDAVFDQDTWMPQVALGMQHKSNRDMGIPSQLGARRGSDHDVYPSATKLYLGAAFGHNLLASATLRATRPNQLGLLGFGGDLNDRYRLRFEGSAAILPRDDLAIGFEYRAKPNNLGAFRERAFNDTFMAWFPAKGVALTLARVSMG